MTQREKLLTLMVAYEQLAAAIGDIVSDVPGCPLPGLTHDRELALAGADAVTRVLARMPLPC
ncbi:MAG TPA: hypothetical protein VGF92_05505 [Stellaceae bacterium]|jgi:hypothetical protein